jgi:tetratricopeptide (TPR) repeat protein
MQQRKAAGKDSEFYWQQRPINMDDIQRYSQRNKIKIIPRPQSSIPTSRQLTSNELVCRTPPPAERPLQLPPQLRIPEKVFHDVDRLVRRSFESGAWRFAGNERIINSSPAMEEEQKHIMVYLSSVDLGCAAVGTGDFSSGVAQWQRAFLVVEDLIKGAYHDIIPNMLTKLTDLHNRGFSDVASMMMQHISQLCLAYQNSDHPISQVFAKLNDISVEHLVEVEDKIRTLFHKIFEVYLGSNCYNTFVMDMDRAKRRLDSSELADLDKCLPSLSSLDEVFGSTNCRPLDVLRLRIEIMYQRRQYQALVEEALVLIDRADKKHDDPWQRHYFLIKAYYYSGSSHFHLGNYECAKVYLECALHLYEKFLEIDWSDQFDSEKAFMLEKLEFMKLALSGQDTANQLAV